MFSETKNSRFCRREENTEYSRFNTILIQTKNFAKSVIVEMVKSSEAVLK